MSDTELEPGTYYQDILTDGTRSALRQNFPTLNRTSFDTRPPVAETRMIVVSTIYSRPKASEVERRTPLVDRLARIDTVINPSLFRADAFPGDRVPNQETSPEVMHEAEELFRMPKQ